MYIFYCYLTLTTALHLLCGRWWPLVCPTSGAIRKFHKGCITVSVRILLPALTNPQGSPDYTWYNWLLEVVVVHLGYRAEVLTYYYSATQSAALPTTIRGSFMYLFVILLVNKCHFWLVRKGENNVHGKTFLYSTIAMTLSWKLLFWLWKRNDCITKNISALVIVYIYSNICKYVGAYFTVTCTYVCYMCMLIFPIEGRVIIHLHHYKTWCCGCLFYLLTLLFVRWLSCLYMSKKFHMGLWTGFTIYTMTYSLSLIYLLLYNRDQF